ncbi:MAG: chromosome segregation protein SMC, partial [Comamonadaceae bacterium]|nr:chromosome segregation protein SMC [Comamonadaceae bacterium]
RRETENRLSDTRENLTRVDDILRELNANLEKLEKQAEVAQRFNALKVDSTLKQQQLWFFKRADAETDQVKIKADVDKAVIDLEARIADLRHVESDLETVRQAHYAAGDQVNQAQGLLYEASAEVSKLEAEIRFVVEGRQRAEQRLLQLQSQSTEWSEKQIQALAELEALAEQALQAEDQAITLAAQVEDQAQALPDLEEVMRQAQAKANEQRGSVVQVQQQIQVLAADQRNIEDQTRQLSTRRERLLADRNALDAPDEQGLVQLKSQLAQADTLAKLCNTTLQDLEEQTPRLDQERRDQQQSVNNESAKLADLTAKIEALKSLQEKVKTDGKLKPWLNKHGLEQLQGLWSKMHMEPGWENAMESALREKLSSLEVSRLDMVKAFASDAPPAKLSFYSPPNATQTSARKGLPAACRPLSDLLRLSDAGLSALLTDWLQGYFTAPSLDDAMAWRDQLQGAECFVVQTGHTVGKHSVSFYAPDSEQAGLLARAQDIENFEKQLRAQTLIAEETRSASVRAEAAYSDAAQRLVLARQEASEAQSKAHELQVETLRLSQWAEQTRARTEQIATDMAEIDLHLEELQERRITAEARFEELDMQLADSQERHAQLDERVIEAERKLSECREQQRTLERLAQEAIFSQRSLEARRSELQRGLETAVQQIKSIADEQERAKEELSRLTDAAAQAGLQNALAMKMEREQVLGAKRSEYDDLTARLRASDERRMSFERELDPMRQRITELQLKEQASRLGLEQYTQLLLDAEADLEALAKSIEEGHVRLTGLQSEIDRLNREIVALGAVNLAALEELTTSRERKAFLDAQTADLTEAMTTLEDAIKKIDAETRDLLAGTFKIVNEHFGRMFPELFGGGSARLVKALTAIALVFAIFQLNPAPFCLLDEVDAPLDDANTERYAKLVKSMGKETQFLFISHNKIAMEMAEQLIGVTMQEQGVSRIVAVDMEAAVSIAETA